jgi:hypothetical protein
VSILISAIENDGKGVPILLRQYLKLNAQVVGFNVDPKFFSVVDGLLIVDLDKTEPRILKRYMGEDGYRRFSQAGSENQGSEVVIQCG